MMVLTTIDHNQHVIFETLKKFLSENKASKAASHWRENYAEGPVLALQRYVSEIYREHQPPVERGEIYRALVNELTNKSDEQTEAKTIWQRQPTAIAQNAHFAEFLRQVLKLISLAHQDMPEMLKAISFKIEEKIQHRSTKLEVLRWLIQPTQDFNARLTQEEKRHIVHEIYLQLCHDLGPIETDQLITRAVRFMQTHYPDGDDPRQYL
jgi:hypothetical protein